MMTTIFSQRLFPEFEPNMTWKYRFPCFIFIFCPYTIWWKSMKIYHRHWNIIFSSPTIHLHFFHCVFYTENILIRNITFSKVWCKSISASTLEDVDLCLIMSLEENWSCLHLFFSPSSTSLYWRTSLNSWSLFRSWSSEEEQSLYESLKRSHGKASSLYSSGNLASAPLSVLATSETSINHVINTINS